MTPSACNFAASGFLRTVSFDLYIICIGSYRMNRQVYSRNGMAHRILYTGTPGCATVWKGEGEKYRRSGYAVMKFPKAVLAVKLLAIELVHRC